MKKLAWIFLFLFGITVASTAQTSTVTASQNEEVAVQDNDVFASVDANTTVMKNEAVVADAKTTVEKSTLDPKQKKEWKKWRDKTTAGKVLMVAGIAFVAFLAIFVGPISSR